MKNPYIKESEPVNLVGERSWILDNAKLRSPGIEEKISWEEFWKACNRDQERLCQAIMNKKLSDLKLWRRKGQEKRARLESEIRDLMLKYIIFA